MKKNIFIKVDAGGFLVAMKRTEKKTVSGYVKVTETQSNRMLSKRYKWAEGASVPALAQELQDRKAQKVAARTAAIVANFKSGGIDRRSAEVLLLKKLGDEQKLLMALAMGDGSEVNTIKARIAGALDA